MDACGSLSRSLSRTASIPSSTSAGDSPAAGVIGADQQHDGAGPYAVDLSMLQAPQYVFRAVAAEPRVEGRARAIKLLPSG